MAEAIDRLKGTVRWFKGRRGFAVITPEDGGDVEEVEEDEFEEDIEELPVGEQRNWAELPGDVLSVIFKEIAAIEIIRSAQFVCSSWRHLSHKPELWRCIDMTGHADFVNMIDMNTLAIEAVSRSSGGLQEFYGKYDGNNELINFVAERATPLRCLRLTALETDELMNYNGLVIALLKFPMLEELELTFFAFSDIVVELVGQECPHLKTFRLNERLLFDHDSKALAIARHMQQLRYLQLFGNSLTNDGLTAILDNCPHLQHLDIRKCLFVNPGENMKKKLAKIKVVRLPNDSTADCPFDASIPDSKNDFEYGDYDYYQRIPKMDYNDISSVTYCPSHNEHLYVELWCSLRSYPLPARPCDS